MVAAVTGGTRNGGKQGVATEVPPRAPRNPSLTVYANGTWKATWSDTRFPQGADENAILPTWNVGFCRDSAAGPQSANKNWSRDVRDKATVLGQYESNGAGQTFNHFQGDVSAGDGWVVIWGVTTVTGKKGEPCQPMHDIVSVTTGAIPDDPQTSFTCTRVAKLTPLVDNTNKIYYFEHDIRWLPPAAPLTEFGGMQTHVTGINGGTDLIEAATECRWNGATGVQEYLFRIPEDTGVGDTVATFTNGSAAVVKVSGAAFAASNNTHEIAVYGANADDTTGVYQAHQLSRTDASHITLTSNFTRPSGNYTMRVYNIWTYYLVAISLSGVRRGDPTASAATFTL